jgi:16S rRNA (guanine527-N7)-methyltransferase
VDLHELESYHARGLTAQGISRLAAFGDLLLRAEHNVTSIDDPVSIERLHFLDALVLLDLTDVTSAHRVVDVGSGGGVPAVVLAVALPAADVVAVESVRKKCDFIARAAETLDLSNLTVECTRAEAFGRSAARESFDVAVIRAVASLPVDAELTAPLVRVGGLFVAMKGALSDEERVSGREALAILGIDALESRQVRPFPGADNRWLYFGRKTGHTPPAYPRRVGVPTKRPLP